MPTYRRFHAFVEDLSRVNQSRIATGMNRPQTHEAIQWHEGDDKLGLQEPYLSKLKDGDYIIIDTPKFPYLINQVTFEEMTELIG